MKKLILLSAALVLSACGETETAVKDKTADAAKTVKTAASAVASKFEGADAGDYSLEKSHAFLWFEVSHNGISKYRVNFTDFDASMNFDPSNATHDANNISVSINPASIITNYTGDYKAGHKDSPYEGWDEALANDPKMLNAGEFPAITFNSTGLKRSDDYSGKLMGDLTFLGVTNPVSLDITYNGTGNKPWFGERDLIGFNASTMIKRSDFGFTSLSPYIGDDVKVTFSGEFLQNE